MSQNFIDKKYQALGWYLAAIGFLGIFSTTISKNPVLPLLVDKLGGKSDVLGLISAMSPLTGILVSFPIGYMSDSIKKKKLLVISATIFVIAPLLYLVVNEPLWLIPVRFFHGMATAIMGPVATAMIVQMYEKNKAEKLGIYSSATLYGRTIAPLVGGLILSSGVSNSLINFRLVYLTAFVASLPILIMVILMPGNSEIKIKKVDFGEMKQILMYFLNQRKLISTTAVEMATYFTYGVLEAYLPIFLINKGVQPSKIGLIFSMQIILVAISKPFFGKLADRIDKRRQILGGATLMGIAVILTSLSFDFVTTAGSILIYALGMSLSTIATGTYIAEQVDRDKQGSALGLLSSLMDVGQTFGPFLIGMIISVTSYNFGFGASAGVMIVTTLLFYFMSLN